MKANVVLVFVLVLAACGSAPNSVSEGVAEVPPPDPAPQQQHPRETPRGPVGQLQEPDGELEAQSVAVQLSGVQSPGNVLVRVATLDLTAAGETLVGTLDGAEIDLGSPTPWELVTFDVPTAPTEATVTLQFEPVGSVVRDGDTEALDCRGPPISVAVDMDAARASGQVVLELDLNASIVDGGNRSVLLPSISVTY